MEKERILITVKTYPTLSLKYGETVCTAGIREDGTWVRIYPVPFRRLNEVEKYKKYDWINCGLIRNTRDPRPESFHPANMNDLVPIRHVDTKHNWGERRRCILGKCKVYRRLQTLIDAARSNAMSLAIFKPTRITDFIFEKEEREWDPAKIAAMRNFADQGELFTEEQWRKGFQVVRKLPYSFSYRFQDELGRKSEMQILDWEIGALYWKSLTVANGNEDAAIASVRKKYFDEFSTKDLHFYLGTIQDFHFRAPNPWVIVGVLPIPHENQSELF